MAGRRVSLEICLRERRSKACAWWTSRRCSPVRPPVGPWRNTAPTWSKLNNPREEGAGFHFSIHRYHTDVNRGKRSVLVDLKAAAGQAILADLVDRADVLIQNFRPGRRRATGRVRGAGACETARSRVRDDQRVRPAGAMDGLARATKYRLRPQRGCAYAGDARPAGQPYAVNDYGTDCSARSRRDWRCCTASRTGHGLNVEAALSYTATVLQSAALHAPAAFDPDSWAGRQSSGCSVQLTAGCSSALGTDQAASLPADYGSASIDDGWRGLRPRASVRSDSCRWRS